MSAPVDYFDSESLRKDLKGKTVRGGKATSVAQVVSLAIGFLSMPVLVRLLDTEDFGLVAMVTVFAGFGSMFVDSGLSMATVQKQEFSRQQASNLFWITTFLGAALSIVFMASSPLISWLYDEPKLTLIAIALACQFLISGLTLQHQALMRRGMQFQQLALIGVVSQIAGQAAAIAWAWCYYGQANDYWALVLLPIATTATRLTLTWAFCHWRPGLPRRGVGTRSMVEFGANLTGFNFVNYFARNADTFLVGWWWGKQQLGFYEKAYALLMLPVRKISPPLTSVVVPALSRLRSDPERYRLAYVAAIRPLAWATVPIVGLLFAISEPLILLYLTPKWAPVVPLFQALVPAAWASSFIGCAGWVYTSWGHVDRHFKWGFIHSLLLILTAAACAPYGVLAVAWGVSAAYVTLRPLSFYICYYGTPIRMSDLGSAIWRPSLIMLVAGGLGFAVAQQLTPSSQAADFTTLVQALIGSAATFLLSAVLLVAVLPGAINEIKRMVSLVSGRPIASSRVEMQ